MVCLQQSSPHGLLTVQMHLDLLVAYFVADRCCWVTAAACEPPPCQKCSTAQAQHSRQMDWLPAGLEFQLPNRMLLHALISWRST